MKPKSVVTCIPSANLERSLKFYSGCFRLEDLAIDEGMIVIELGNLSLFVMSQQTFEQYTSKIGITAEFPGSSAQVLHACAVDDPAMVNHLFATAEAFGGTIAQSMHMNEWGQQAGYLRDPDGHVWEIVQVE